VKTFLTENNDEHHFILNIKRKTVFSLKWVKVHQKGTHPFDGKTYQT